MSVKLTPEAQTELLHLFDIVIQCDINILTECEALQNVLAKLRSASENQMKVVNNARKTSLLQTDTLMMKRSIRLLDMFFAVNSADYNSDMFDKIHMSMPSILSRLFPHVDQRSLFPVSQQILPLIRSNLVSQRPFTSEQIRHYILNIPCRTALKFLLLKYLRFFTYIEYLFLLPHWKENQILYKLQRIIHDGTFFDILSSKLWYAIVLLKQRDYDSALSIINHALSSFPPYAMYNSETEIINSERKRLYIDTFQNSSCTTMQRAMKAWLIDLMFTKKMSDILPLAIQIELYFCGDGSDSLRVDRAVKLSPYTCTYYLMFQCYHELGQYDNRNHALCRLIQVTNNEEQCGIRQHHCYNIAGHCLLVAGQTDRARDMFNRSRRIRYEIPLLDECNPASWYIRNFCSVTR